MTTSTTLPASWAPPGDGRAHVVDYGDGFLGLALGAAEGADVLPLTRYADQVRGAWLTLLARAWERHQATAGTTTNRTKETSA
jgi:hypothetical protein